MDGYEEGSVIVGRYRVGATLGQGGMGIVLAAHDERMDRPVALKFLLPALRAKPNIVARFEREGRNAAKIDDEHVARVYNVEATEDGVPFIVMERLEGQTLAKVIEARGQIPIVEAVDYVLQVCEALAQAHKQGIVHRDLKPQNLFLTKTAYGAVLVKVLDFGISKTADDDGLTRTGAVVGSPAYMSPEQLRAQEVDPRSDVWALGVTFYHLVAGVPPFRGEVAVIPHAILEGRFEPLGDHRSDVSDALEDVVTQALIVDLPSRLESVEALAAKLAPFGTEKARESYARIQAIVSPAPLEGPKEPVRPPSQLGPVAMTSADRSTSISQEIPKKPAAPRRKLPAALALLGGMAVVVMLVRASTRTPVPPITAPVPSASPEPSASAAKESPLDRLTQECAAGSGDSCNRLGLLYDEAKDDLQAFEAYDQGCRKGHPQACVNLGSKYYEGKGIAKDEKTGAEMFQRGCDGREARGCRNVGIAYRDGKGYSKDLPKAFEYFQRACDGHDLVGCTERAAAKVRGDGVPRDVKWGRDQLRDLCPREQGACTMLAGFEAQDLGKDAPASPGRVREALKTGCKADSGVACAASALVDAELSTRSTEAKMKASYKAGCDKGGVVFCRYLGNMLVMGTPAEKEEGKKVLGKACADGDGPSCKVLNAAPP